jgi:hypothetical protein
VATLLGVALLSCSPTLGDASPAKAAPVVGLLAGSLYLTGSRAAMAGVGAGVLVLTAYHLGGRRLLRYSLLVGGVGAGLTAVFLVKLGGSPLLTEVIPGRLRLWTAAIEVISRRPLFGYGLAPVGPLVGPELPLGAPTGNLHSTYLKMVVSAGFVGGVAFGIGYLSHVLVDGLHATVEGEFENLTYLVWPVLPLPESEIGKSFLAHILALEFDAWFAFELSLVALAFGLWNVHGRPGLDVLRALVRLEKSEPRRDDAD